MDLEGVILVHRDFGYCKVTAHNGNTVQVHFTGTDRTASYGVQAIAAQKDFKWRPIPVGMQCRVAERGTCTIAEASFGPSETHGVHDYLVIFEGEAGETARLTERELWPIPGSLIESPLTRLTALRGDPVAHFRAREGMLDAFRQIDRESADVRALAASRITLLPHQAFVIGTVVDDPVWRYILADEVGLGKTIEAGVIAHQLLAEKPDARILVLCPGSLARQWLCEMHVSFGGRSFRLLDLYQPGQVSLKAWPLVISSLKLAVRQYQDELLSTAWDLVIVDEAHQLLWHEGHYGLVERLANQVPRLLLLSAVPAREREAELMRLLRLLNPRQYRAGSPAANQFAALYAAQSTIGRRLRIVMRQLQDLGGLDREQLDLDMERLLAVEMLGADPELREFLRLAKGVRDPVDARIHYQGLVDQIVARYRISRRILKNRRTRLVDAELLQSVARTVELVSYAPSLLEARISAVSLDLLQLLADESHTAAFQVFFRKFAQSFCDPVALWEITSALLTTAAGTAVDLQMFDANAAFDYDEHDVILEGLGAAFADRLDKAPLSELADLLRTAVDVPEQRRMSALVAHLEQLFAQGAAKVLVFAGTFGAAEYVLEALTGKFGAPAVASFRHDLKDGEKERQVTRFRRDPVCHILVSDESGGEGRNFQFADEIVHFDLPWSVAAVEQRIGRLDRIGRDRAVRSSVICASSGLEYAWFRCLAEGFSVFNRSISGLEFMLNEAERQAVTVATNDGAEGLIELLPQLLATSERERATDDAETMTDAASFHNTNRYLQAREHSGDELLEKWLPCYLRAIGRSSAAKQVTDLKDLNLRIWRLKPEDVSDYQLVGMERQGENPLAEVFGTFTRAVARERPDLDFFAVGHPLVDALAVASREHVRGRSLLARFSTDLVAPGLVLLAGWRARAPTNPDPVPERALRRLEGRVVWTGMDLETGEPLDGTIAAQLADRLRAEDAIAHDLDPDHAVEAFQPVTGQWSATLNDLLALAASRATDMYAARYGQSDAGFCEQLRADARTVVSTRIEENEGYGKEVEAIAAAIGAAQVTLDVLGLLQIVAPVAP